MTLQAGVAVEAVLLGVDSVSGKVWLSIRQVQPDPLQQTLDALLAQGPPAATAPDAAANGITGASHFRPEPSHFNEDESMVSFYSVAVWFVWCVCIALCVEHQVCHSSVWYQQCFVVP